MPRLFNFLRRPTGPVGGWSDEALLAELDRLCLGPRTASADSRIEEIAAEIERRRQEKRAA